MGSDLSTLQSDLQNGSLGDPFGLESGGQPQVTLLKEIDPEAPVHTIIEMLAEKHGLTWLLPTIRALIQQESSNNPYLIHTGKKHTKRIEKLLPFLEEMTGTVWSLNPFGESPAANEISVGLWQYNLGGGKGSDYTNIDLGIATDDELIQAIFALSDPVAVSIDAMSYIGAQAQTLIGMGVSPGDVAESILRPWSGRHKALEAFRPTSFDEAGEVESLSIVPKKEDYTEGGVFDRNAFMADTERRAELLAIQGLPLPEDASEYFRLAYGAALVLNKDIIPTEEDKELARLELDTIRQNLLIGEQRLRTGEPVGMDKVIRTTSGQTGYRDYWAGNPVSEQFKNDTDYMAGYNFGVAEERPNLLDAQAGAMDRIISQIGNTMESRKLRTTQVIEEFNRNLAAFNEGGKQFLGALPFAFTPRDGHFPGREPGGFGESIGLNPVPFTGTQFDPFQMSLDLIRNTTPVTDVGVPNITPVPPNAFNEALAIYQQLVGAR